jgi:DNA-binding response OmpR family regulator
MRYAMMTASRNELCGVSSAVEHLPYTQGVTGSNPVPRTKLMLPLLKRKPRVLLLDDDPSMQRLVSSLLKREGYKVDVFLTGRDAMRALEANDYDVLLLDLMMPHEGGMTVIRHLGDTKPELLSRALVLSASPQSVIRSVKDEVAGVVKKPFEQAELIGAVKRIRKLQ